MFLSLTLFLLSSLSKINKHILGWGLKKLKTENKPTNKQINTRGKRLISYKEATKWVYADFYTEFVEVSDIGMSLLKCGKKISANLELIPIENIQICKQNYCGFCHTYR